MKTKMGVKQAEINFKKKIRNGKVVEIKAMMKEIMFYWKMHTQSSPYHKLFFGIQGNAK